MKRFAAISLFMIGLATLVALGTWQYERLQWKEALIADLNAQYDALAAKSSVITRTRLQQALSEQERPFLVDKAAGTFLRDKNVFVGPSSRNGTSGYDVIAPMRIDDGTLLVHLGWIEADARETLSLPRGSVIVHGVARRPDYSSFTSKNSPANELWFQADIDQIAAARDIRNVAPLILYANDAQPAIEGIEMPAERWLPRNKHFQYMMFWYGMAAAWVAVFALAWRRYRQG